ncbi:MAG: radical SAM protein [Candidatus Angelobacter sp.]
MPSRFNARSTTPEGDLILWNSFSGAINLFPAEQKTSIAKILSRAGVVGEPTGIVDYLRNRGYLVKEGTDEYRRVQVAFGQRQFRSDVLELILLASEDCNFRCVYCYEEFARGTMQPRVRNAVKRYVEERAPDLKKLTISWFGGEPLYGFKAIEDLGPFFKEISEKHGLRFGSHMTTNGYLLTPEVAEKLLAWGVADFQISLDGSPEQHDCRRKARDGSGTFARILANLLELKKREESYRVTLRVNYDRETFRELKAFFDVLQTSFANDPRFVMAFHAVGALGGSKDNELPLCGIKDMNEARTLLPVLAIERGLNVATLAENSGVGAQVCYAARPYNFIIGATGKVMKCTVALDKEDYNVLGRITDDGELEIDQDKLAKWVAPAFESDTGCQKCQLLPTCQGMLCPWVRFEQGRAPCPGYKSDMHAELNVLANVRWKQHQTP